MENTSNHQPIHRAVRIANYFLAKRRRLLGRCKPIEGGKLTRLVLLAHGWNLAIHGRPLFTEGVRTAEFGPYVPEFHLLIAVMNGAKPIRKRLPETREEMPRDYSNYPSPYFPPHGDAEKPAEAFTTEQEELLDTIFETYSNLSYGQMNAQLTEDDSPWAKVYAELGEHQLIDNGMLREHFRTIATRNPQAKSAQEVKSCRTKADP